MTHQVKMLAAKPNGLSVIPRDPHGRRREPTPSSYSVTSTHTVPTHTVVCVHSYTNKKLSKKLMETDLIFCNIKQETEHSALTVTIDVMCT